jgi:lysophospholipase L1-like esterase
MADAPKILGTDSLRQAYPKLNQAIDNSNEALKKSSLAMNDATNAISKVNEAKAKAEAVQTQLNTIVVSGDSSPAADQARLDITGYVHASLKARLDEEQRSLMQPSLAKYCQDMANGGNIIIDCYGDSTYYGRVSGGSGQVETPAPLMLQKVLRAYFGNELITVNNKGISGNQTTNALRTFDANMAESGAHIIYINYGLNDLSGANPSGVNDPAINAEQYKNNLRKLVGIARKYGKVVILETPNIEIITHESSSYQFRIEGAQQFSEAMKQVAREMNVPLVDQQYFMKKYVQTATKIQDAYPDGIHPSQEVYLQKGINMALPLVLPIKIKEPTIIPAGIPGWQATNALRSSNNAGSRTGVFYFSDNSVRTFIWIDSPGLDVYIAPAQYSNGSANVEARVDDNIVGIFSMKDSSFSNPYAVDSEILVLKDAKPGLHLIELRNADVTGRVGAYYLRTYKTRKKSISYASTGTMPTAILRDVVAQDVVISVTNAGEYCHAMLDIPTSRLLETLDVEVIATLNKGDGITLFTKPNSNNSGPHGGLYFWLSPSTGRANFSEGNGPTGFANITELGTTDYSGIQRKYRITVTPSGLATFYVDDVQIGNFNMTKPHFGGFLGFYKNTAGTLRIDRVAIN